IVSTYKIDGVSCSLIYENSQLTLAKTRGDGSFGEDITAKARWISDIAGTLIEKNISAEVRGEIYCTEENFYKLSLEMESLGLEKPTSQRNIVAGLVGRKDHVELSRFLSFQAFEWISDDLSPVSEIEKLKLMKREGFAVPDVELHKDLKSIKRIIEEARQFMSEGDYQIDGLVFTINDV